jgi:hypothetical protein
MHVSPHLQRRPTEATSPSLTAALRKTKSSSADACADEPMPIQIQSRPLMSVAF